MSLISFAVFLVVELNFVSTWGDLYYMGLTGLELLGPNHEEIPLSCSMLKVGAKIISLLPIAAKIEI